MAKNLNQRVAAVERAVTPTATDVPTPSEIWRWQLVWAVDHARTGQAGLHTHAAVLQSKADVLAASDDVLLEALGLPNVKGFGWLRFMVRDLTWVCMLLANWNLPHLLFLDCHVGDTTEAERRAYAALQFCELMGERHGFEVMTSLRAVARKLMDKNGWTEAQWVEYLRERNEWFYFLYTCETTPIRPEVLRAGNRDGRVLYPPAARLAYLAEMRGSAAI